MVCMVFCVYGVNVGKSCVYGVNVGKSHGVNVGETCVYGVNVGKLFGEKAPNIVIFWKIEIAGGRYLAKPFKGGSGGA